MTHRFLLSIVALPIVLAVSLPASGQTVEPVSADVLAPEELIASRLYAAYPPGW
jgi:hypothetical protein